MQYQLQLRPDQIEALYHLKVELRQPMIKLVREAVDHFLELMKCKQEQAYRAGTTLSDWLAYEQEMEEEASSDANAPF